MPVIASILPEECDIPSICRPKNGAGRSRTRNFHYARLTGRPNSTPGISLFFYAKHVSAHNFELYCSAEKNSCQFE